MLLVAAKFARLLVCDRNQQSASTISNQQCKFIRESSTEMNGYLKGNE